MAYRIFIKSKYDGALEEIDDEIYQSKEEAEDAFDETINNFMTGAEVLELSGEGYRDPDDYDFLIKKI